MELIRRHSEGRPTLVFVSTRKATTQAATVILNDARRMGLMQELVRNEAQRQRLEAAAQSLPSEMQELVRHGVGPHHGGLDFHCRAIIEQLFANNDLRVLCSTSTLGQGINLPAFLVIVRGTVRWIDHTEKELDSSTLTQMIGRAGRPQFDTEGVAVVMTSSNKLQQYSSILRGVPIESHLFERMIEHLNAEIVGSGIGTESTCMRWLKLTSVDRANTNKAARLKGYTHPLTFACHRNAGWFCAQIHVHTNEEGSNESRSCTSKQRLVHRQMRPFL